MKLSQKQLSITLKSIKAIVMDVDGVLTDGTIFLDQRGEEIKAFYSADGLAITSARRMGLKIAFISARASKALASRAKELGIDALYQNKMNKIQSFEKILKDFKLQSHEVCYIGDDLVDIPVLKRAGLAIAVQNAAPEIKKISSYVTEHSGGRGAVREVIEKIMKAQGSWQKLVEDYASA